MTGVGVVLPAGSVEVSISTLVPTDAVATLVFGHGAGAGREHPFLTGFAEGLAEHGIATLLFNFPYVEAGRRMPGPAAHAVATWNAVSAWAREQLPGPVWAGGKSYGGRMASVAVADGMSAAGLIYLGYPFHPPGQPEKARGDHLPAIAVPQLFVEGTKDPFIDPHEQFESAVAACQDATIEWIIGGGHSFDVAGHKRPAGQIGRELAPIAGRFVRERHG